MSVFEPMREWPQMANVISYLDYGRETSGLEPMDMVHIGGTALWYRLKAAFGSEVQFRGTHDVDVITWIPGHAQRICQAVVSLTNDYFTGAYELNKSSSIADKLVAIIHTTPSILAGQKNEIPLDMYFSDNPAKTVAFNNRRFTQIDPETKLPKIVIDTPEIILTQYDYANQVAVPSLRDHIILKLDILDSSRSGLREKDIYDIFAIIKLLEYQGVDIERFSRSLITDILTWHRKENLISILRNQKTLRRYQENSPHFPTQSALSAFTKGITN